MLEDNSALRQKLSDKSTPTKEYFQLKTTDGQRRPYVPQCSSVSLEEEFQHVQRWSETNKKFKLICPKPKNLYLDVHLHVITSLYHSLCRLLSNWQSQNFLGVYISVTVSAAAHVEHILSVANQRMYLLGQLKSQGLSCNALHIVFTAIVLSVVTYALPSFAGQLSKGDKARIDSLFRKAFRRGFCCQTFSMDDLISAWDKKLFRQMSSESQCLHPLLPTQRNLQIVSGNAATTTSFLKFNLLYSRTVSWIGVYFLTFSVVIFLCYCFMHFILHFIKWLYLLSVIVYCIHIVKCVRLTYINKRLLTYLLTWPNMLVTVVVTSA